MTRAALEEAIKKVVPSEQTLLLWLFSISFGSFPISFNSSLFQLVDLSRLIIISQHGGVSSWSTSLILRFTSAGLPVRHDDHALAHLSLEAAAYCRDVIKVHTLAVQAPSLDRADCPGCDVHRVLFGSLCFLCPLSLGFVI